MDNINKLLEREYNSYWDERINFLKFIESIEDNEENNNLKKLGYVLSNYMSRRQDFIGCLKYELEKYEINLRIST